MIRNAGRTSTADPIKTPSQIKRLARKAAFASSAIRDYQTGMESQFEIRPRPVQDRQLSSRLGGPQMKTQQFERTVKR